MRLPEIQSLLFISAFLTSGLAAYADTEDFRDTDNCVVRFETTPERALDSAELLEFVPCLESPEPAIRDDYAYTLLAESLRAHQPTPESIRALRDQLIMRVTFADQDPLGIRGPFAMLALSEVARTDRVAPWMSSEERSALVQTAHDYLTGLSDYRGFSDAEGWRHGVAHAADLLMQLSLNPEISAADAVLILKAVGAKVAPADAPAYVFGEPDRLARPILFLARTDLVTGEMWDGFFAGLMPDVDEPRWDAPYGSESGLIALHNTRSFAMSLYTNASVSETEVDDFLVENAAAILLALP